MIAGTGNENARARKQLGLRSSSSMRTNFWRHYRTLAVGTWELGQRLDTIKMCHSTYFPNVCVSVIFTYCQNGGETDGVGFYYLAVLFRD